MNLPIVGEPGIPDRVKNKIIVRISVFINNDKTPCSPNQQIEPSI